MITFPSWVEGTGRNAPNAAELARRRMRYMLMRASIECTEAGSVASLADLCGLPREHLHYAIRAGGMSPKVCLLYTSPSPRDQRGSRMPSSA